jgi:hypothetical protein
MNDITQYRIHRLITEAAQYRIMRRIYDADPNVGPGTAALLRDCFRTDRDDAAFLREISNGPRC